MIQKPFNFLEWINENRSLLKPPVGNKVVFDSGQDLIVMVVAGPNARKDYHLDVSEEVFFQIEGSIQVKLMLEDGPEVYTINQGEIFMVPGGVPHMPIRPANTLGIVLERKRKLTELDGFLWFCENCGHKLYEKFIPVQDIEADLPKVMQEFYESPELRKCNQCATTMQPPAGF